MQLSAPKFVTFIIAVIIALVGILAYIIAIPILSLYAFWIVVIAFILLALATMLKGL